MIPENSFTRSIWIPVFASMRAWQHDVSWVAHHGLCFADEEPSSPREGGGPVLATSSKYWRNSASSAKPKPAQQQGCRMSLATVHSRATLGIEAPPVTVEVHLSGGLPSFNIVGLPETVVKESRERVRSAILNAQLEFPQRRITVNLAPADLPKTGGRFDLAIAIGILAASGQVEQKRLEGTIFLGELALSGEVRRVNGILPGLLASQREGRCCIIPRNNESEAGLLPTADILLCGHLLDLLRYYHDEGALPKPGAIELVPQQHAVDFNDVVGQDSAKRALIIAAAGGHNVLLRGPPGTGKTMLASRLVTILPALTNEQAMEVAAIQSISGTGFRPQAWLQPPFRAPHHTSSAVALVGGGSTLHTGEISLAHHGVLFLDELPEFSVKVLEALREPLEAGYVQIARAKYQVRLPASFQLVAACNPCPCGYHGDTQRECRCAPERVKQYQQRVSGPLLDRIDLQVSVPRLNESERQTLLQQGHAAGPDSDSIRAEVVACRELQVERAGRSNAKLDPQQVKQHCALASHDTKLLSEAITRLRLSARATFRILKIARTVADLDEAERIATPHLLEAINYRRFDTL
jgi:magnesium chelatase family protein